MLWCTWVLRPLSFLPVIDTTSSPDSAMAAARIPSHSCKAEAQGQSQTCLEVLTLHSVVGMGLSPLSGTLSPGLRALRDRALPSPSDRAPGEGHRPSSRT